MRPCSDRVRPRCSARWRSRDVVRGGAREVDEVGAETPGRRGHDVELRALAQREAGTRRAVRDRLGAALVALVREGREQPAIVRPGRRSRRAGRGRRRSRSPRRAEPAIVAERTLGSCLRERDETLGERSAHRPSAPGATAARRCCSSDSRMRVSRSAPMPRTPAQASGATLRPRAPRVTRCRAPARARPRSAARRPVSRSIDATPAAARREAARASVMRPLDASSSSL